MIILLAIAIVVGIFALAVLGFGSSNIFARIGSEFAIVMIVLGEAARAVGYEGRDINLFAFLALAVVIIVAIQVVGRIMGVESVLDAEERIKREAEQRDR